MKAITFFCAAALLAQTASAQTLDDIQALIDTGDEAEAMLLESGDERALRAAGEWLALEPSTMVRNGLVDHLDAIVEVSDPDTMIEFAEDIIFDDEASEQEVARSVELLASITNGTQATQDQRLGAAELVVIAQDVHGTVPDHLWKPALLDLRKRAEGGNPGAIEAMAFMLAYDDGIENDYPAAIALFQELISKAGSFEQDYFRDQILMLVGDPDHPAYNPELALEMAIATKNAEKIDQLSEAIRESRQAETTRAATGDLDEGVARAALQAGLPLDCTPFPVGAHIPLNQAASFRSWQTALEGRRVIGLRDSEVIIALAEAGVVTARQSGSSALAVQPALPDLHFLDPKETREDDFLCLRPGEIEILDILRLEERDNPIEPQYFAEGYYQIEPSEPFEAYTGALKAKGASSAELPRLMDLPQTMKFRSLLIQDTFSEEWEVAATDIAPSEEDFRSEHVREAISGDR